MISSVAGKNGNPLTSAYSASKHAIEGLSESLRREMMLFGIDVIIIAPGAVKTPIWGKAEEVDISAYKNSPYFPALEKIRAFMMHLGEIGLPAETIAETIVEALTSANPKVRYQITPDPMRHLMTALLPKRTVDRIIAKRLGLMPRHEPRAENFVGAAAMVALASVAHAGDQGDPEQSCDGNTFQMVECLKAQDRAMGQADDYRLSAGAEGRRRGAARPLRAAQRLWIQYRDANCLYYGMGEGTIARIDAGECMRNMTEGPRQGTGRPRPWAQ